MNEARRRQWATHLRMIGERALDDAPTPAAGPVIEPFMAWFERRPAPMPPADADGDVALWAAAAGAAVDVDARLGARTDGPLFPVDLYRAIEVWTEADLSALHALAWLARRSRSVTWRERLVSARDWHVDHTQPDNATNRPWALPVFLLADRPETTHYAETLLHNAMTIGTMDVLSATILVDAARFLDDDDPAIA